MSSMLKQALHLALILTLGGIWLFAEVGEGHACSCAPPGSPSKALAESTAVFAGKVTSIAGYGPPPYSSFDPVTVVFEVSTVWKGPSFETMAVTTARDGATCGFAFTEGETYIVYSGWEGAEETPPQVSLCSRTGLLAQAQDDLVELGEGHAPEPATMAPVPEPTKRSLPIVGGCGVSPYPGSAPREVSGLGLMAGLFFLGVWRRARR